MELKLRHEVRNPNADQQIKPYGSHQVQRAMHILEQLRSQSARTPHHPHEHQRAIFILSGSSPEPGSASRVRSSDSHGQGHNWVLSRDRGPSWTWS